MTGSAAFMIITQRTMGATVKNVIDHILRGKKFLLFGGLGRGQLGSRLREEGSVTTGRYRKLRLQNAGVNVRVVSEREKRGGEVVNGKEAKGKEGVQKSQGENGVGVVRDINKGGWKEVGTDWTLVEW